MKYIQDDQLAQWTSALTDVSIGHSRLLHGRLEVYSMKRVTSEKKDAVRLGEKYVEQIQQDQEASNILNIASPTRRKRRSVSAGRLEEASSVTFAADARTMGNATTAPPAKRPRSCSLDEGLKPSTATALGDFSEQSTRRLMTDLVLTLNAAFPDYDFSSIKPSDFTKMSIKKAGYRINESLSEWAAASPVYNNLNELWKSIDAAVQLNDCDVYKFIPTEDTSFLLNSVNEDAVGSEDGEIDDEGTPTLNGATDTVLWSFYYLFVNKQAKRILLFSVAESMRHTNYSDDDGDGEERFVQVSDAGVLDVGDFDLDPESNTAGGIPISSI